QGRDVRLGQELLTIVRRQPVIRHNPTLGTGTDIFGQAPESRPGSVLCLQFWSLSRPELQTKPESRRVGRGQCS
ncbi:MAG TPA: hypothetical protein VGI96_51410, partial [Streptosporangiaceae bacterium]